VRLQRRTVDPDTLVILFCAYTGVRAAELAGLNVETCG
jgi:integrase